MKKPYTKPALYELPKKPLRSADPLHSEVAKHIGDVYLEPDGAVIVEWNGPWLEEVLETGQINALVASLHETATRLELMLRRNTQ